MKIKIPPDTVGCFCRRAAPNMNPSHAAHEAQKLRMKIVVEVLQFSFTSPSQRIQTIMILAERCFSFH